MPTMKKMLLWNYHIVGSRERDLANFKVLGIYLKFISEISLVISLHDWFTFIGALAADKLNLNVIASFKLANQVSFLK